VLVVIGSLSMPEIVETWSVLPDVIKEKLNMIENHG